MAVDVAAICSMADATQGTQTLAIVLSVMFSVYTIIAIALSALTIYSTSQVPIVDMEPVGAQQVAGSTGSSLVALKR
tara:strand:+ start:541 stop:771 length:231 start_codon:yes stop_codon:yes gene_type:complete